MLVRGVELYESAADAAIVAVPVTANNSMPLLRTIPENLIYDIRLAPKFIGLRNGF